MAELATRHWMMNEVNALVWPSPNGIGVLDQDTYAADDRNGDCGFDDPDRRIRRTDAIRTDLVEAALAGIDDDATGEDCEKPVVEVTPGGE